MGYPSALSRVLLLVKRVTRDQQLVFPPGHTWNRDAAVQLQLAAAPPFARVCDRSVGRQL